MCALDREHLRRAAGQLTPDRRALLSDLLLELITILKTERPQP